MITATTTFYISIFNGTCESVRVPATAIVTQPDSITATTTSNNICPNNQITLDYSQDGITNNYDVYQWTASPKQGSGLLGTGTTRSFDVTPTSAGTYTYSLYARDTTLNCGYITTVQVVVKTQPIITEIFATKTSVCIGESVVLSATGTNIDSYVWNPGSFSGQTFTVTPNGTTEYVVTASNNNGCYTTTGITITVHNLPEPVSVVNNDNEQCGYGFPTATLISNSGAPVPVFNWYNTGGNGGTLLQSGTSQTYLTAINETTNLWACEISEFGCEGSRIQLIASVIQPDQISASASTLNVNLGNSFDMIAYYTLGFNNYTQFTISGSPLGSGVDTLQNMVILDALIYSYTEPYTITPTLPGTYTYTIIAYDFDFGCASITQISISVNL